MSTPPRLIVTDTLTADGLRGLDLHQRFAARSADESAMAGDERGASLWRRRADAWLGKRADLLAG